MLTKDEIKFYEAQVDMYTNLGSDDAEAHREAAFDTAAKFRTDATRYATLAPASDDTIKVGDTVMVTLDDAPAALAATVIEISGSRHDCRLTRNGMVVSIWRSAKIRKAA